MNSGRCSADAAAGAAEEDADAGSASAVDGGEWEQAASMCWRTFRAELSDDFGVGDELAFNSSAVVSAARLLFLLLWDSGILGSVGTAAAAISIGTVIGADSAADMAEAATSTESFDDDVFRVVFVEDALLMTTIYLSYLRK
jgi:hypothetical protein